jgi:hypothetical protein
MTPRIRSLIAVVVLIVAFAGAAACGIDEDEVATGATTTRPQGGTTTSKPGGPNISLPDIPPDVTESTVPDPSTSSIPSGEETPAGVTPDALAATLLKAGLTQDQADCVAAGVFAEFDGDTIDQMVAANDLADLGGDIEQKFTEIVQTCLQGG